MASRVKFFFFFGRASEHVQCLAASSGLLCALAFFPLTQKRRTVYAEAGRESDSLGTGGFSPTLFQRSLLSPPDSNEVQRRDEEGNGGFFPSANWALAHYPHSRLPSYENLRVRDGYMSSVNFRLRIPNWVAEKVTQETLSGEASRDGVRFFSDPTVPFFWNARHTDYWNSGYSRGHMATASSHKNTQKTLAETFSLSGNCLPQDMANNGSDWLMLERFAQNLTRHFDEVFVLSGPLFLPQPPKRQREEEQEGSPAPPLAPLSLPPSKGSDRQTKEVSYDVIGPQSVAVPTHLFKIIFCRSPKKAKQTEETESESPHQTPTRPLLHRGSLFGPDPSSVNFPGPEGETGALPSVSPSNQMGEGGSANGPSGTLMSAFVTPNRNLLQAPKDGAKAFQVPVSFLAFHSGLDLSGIVPPEAAAALGMNRRVVQGHSDVEISRVTSNSSDVSLPTFTGPAETLGGLIEPEGVMLRLEADARMHPMKPLFGGREGQEGRGKEGGRGRNLGGGTGAAPILPGKGGESESEGRAARSSFEVRRVGSVSGGLSDANSDRQSESGHEEVQEKLPPVWLRGYDQVRGAGDALLDRWDLCVQFGCSDGKMFDSDRSRQWRYLGKIRHLQRRYRQLQKGYEGGGTRGVERNAEGGPIQSSKGWLLEELKKLREEYDANHFKEENFLIERAFKEAAGMQSE
uniref:DNA/RNA non-specific endonuclease domain-containing protein n=1 Tax=Chromera velia CCMP2878 TaxID=1169474 RepID=A0A0G4G6E2_9ALVE|eukprot:Cvel_20486.t1-p1 / transcript=Cvel_20486.t1 / gene=Cvel_20486 / organism=Chromera_velia_CCMP2878 / gene_product=Nuclease EXOG, mitochondrial, putative / transcript_product=Nuclease EXOG, mitochondrial, putative / location=Cvel_scaffold1842:10643-12700(+) / protein_length=686 / sequence_SO=supercontig / SO=protein_coding / is_pseudo=false